MYCGEPRNSSNQSRAVISCLASRSCFSFSRDFRFWSRSYSRRSTVPFGGTLRFLSDISCWSMLGSFGSLRVLVSHDLRHEIQKFVMRQRLLQKIAVFAARLTVVRNIAHTIVATVYAAWVSPLPAIATSFSNDLFEFIQ